MLSLSDRVLSETVARIAQAVDKHVSGSEAVRETAFPTDSTSAGLYQKRAGGLAKAFLAGNIGPSGPEQLRLLRQPQRAIFRALPLLAH